MCRMAEWATFVVVPENGDPELYEARFGAVGLDLDLLAGPEVVLTAVRARYRTDGWRRDGTCQGAALFDLRQRVLLLFAWEGPIARPRHRQVTWEALGRAWPGWELRWTYDGPADLLVHLGLDPAEVRERDGRVYPELVLGPGDGEFDERDPCVGVVTLADRRVHLLSSVNHHPIAEGPALLDRLATAPDHGTYALSADCGLHIDPVRRRVGWWLLGALAEAGTMADRWPGWTVEFWEDRWQEHVRTVPGRFAPPPVHREQALTELIHEAQDHWSQRPGDPWVSWMQAALPEAVTRSVVAALGAWE